MGATLSSSEILLFLHHLLPRTGFWQLNAELHRLVQLLLVSMAMQNWEGLKPQATEVQASPSELQTAPLATFETAPRQQTIKIATNVYANWLIPSYLSESWLYFRRPDFQPNSAYSNFHRDILNRDCLKTCRLENWPEMLNICLWMCRHITQSIPLCTMDESEHNCLSVKKKVYICSQFVSLIFNDSKKLQVYKYIFFHNCYNQWLDAVENNLKYCKAR